MENSRKNALATTVKGQKMKPMYHTSEITNRTNKNLWVVYPTNSDSGYVYSMSYTRDEVRNAGRSVFGTNIQNVRSCRVDTWRKRNM